MLCLYSHATAQTPKSHLEGIDASYNFYNVTNAIDASNIKLNWTQSQLKEYERTKWLFDDRLRGTSAMETGKPGTFVDAVKAFSGSAVCDGGESDWGFVGPFFFDVQSQGRIIAVHMYENDRNTILAGAATSGIWRTEDGGVNWNCVTDNLRHPGIGINDFAVKPGDDNVVLAALGLGQFNYGMGLLISTNKGKNWNIVDVPSAIPVDQVAGAVSHNVDFDPNVPCEALVSFGRRLFWYNTCSNIYTEVTPPASQIHGANNHWFHDIEVMDDGGNTIVVVGSKADGNSSSNALVSTDRGATWHNFTDQIVIMGNGSVLEIAGDMEGGTIGNQLTHPFVSSSSAPNYGFRTWKYEIDPLDPTNIVAAALPDINDPIQPRQPKARLKASDIFGWQFGRNFDLVFDARVPKDTKLTVFARHFVSGLGDQFLPIWESNSGAIATTDMVYSNETLPFLVDPSLGDFGMTDLWFEATSNATYAGADKVIMDNIDVILNELLVHRNIEVEHDNMGNIYAATDEQIIYKSSDYGITWSFYDDCSGVSLFHGDFAINKDFPEWWYMDNVVLLKGNLSSGISTEVGPAGFHGIHGDTRAIQIVASDPTGNGNDVVLIGNDGGITFTPDGYATTLNINGKGLNNTQFYGMDVTDKSSKVIIGGTQDNGTLGGDGESWTRGCGSDGGDVHINELTGTTSVIQHGCCGGWNLTTLTGISSCGGPGSGGLSDGSLESNFDRSKLNPDRVWYGGLKYLRNTNDNFGSFNIVNPSDPFVADFKTKYRSVNIYDKNDNIVIVAAGNHLNAEGVTSPSDIHSKLFLTLDNGSNWTDLTRGSNSPELFDALKWATITHVTFHPEDPSKIWISTNYTSATPSGKRSVLFTDDNGASWTDVSLGLPGLPVQKLVFVDGGGNSIYAATDVGVYYKSDATDESTPWECFNNNLPVAMVSDLEINNCTKEIFISTYGRGIWKSKLPVNNLGEDLSHGQSLRTITGEEKYLNNLIVPTNSEVILEGKIFMSAGKSITVKKGGKFTVNGGTITNQCGVFWDGIIIEGDVSSSQLNPANRGIVLLENAVIEYARNAVQLIGEDSNGNLDWNTTGGVISANNSTFRNNWRSIEFMSYDVGGNNLSKVTNSLFLTDLNYPDKEDGPYAHVTMYDIQGVDFENNVFDNLAWEEFDFDKRGSGLVMLDASMRVGPVCGFFDPFCSDFTRSNSFNNLYAGVISLEGSTHRKATIDQNNFSNCVYGIRMAGTNTKSDVTRNKFQISNADGAVGTSGTRYWDFGIYSDGVSGSKIEDNDFTSYSSTESYLSTGIFKKNGDILASEIFLNDFADISIGLQTSQNNLALEYDCNGFDIGSNSIVGHHHSTGLMANQGDCGSPLQFSKMANNWTGTCDILNSKYQHYRNPGTNLFEYDSYIGEGYVPTSCAFDLSTAEICIGVPEPVEQCVTSLVNTPIGTGKGKYFALLEQKILFEEQIDAGDADALLDVIANGPDGQVKNELLSLSPFLSDKVLIEYLWSNPPNGNLKQVLLANSPLSEKVLFWLESDNIPNGILNQIQNVQTGIRPLDQIEKEIAMVNLNKNIELARLTRRFLDSAWIDSTWIDTAVYYLELDGSSEASCALVPIEIKRDPVKASQHLTSIRLAGEDMKKYELPGDKKGDNVISFCDFHELLTHVKQRPGGYYSLTSSEMNELDVIANKGDVGVRANAEAILNFVKNSFPYIGGEDILGAGKSLSSIKSDKENPGNEIIEKEVDINPNPTSGMLNILSEVELEAGKVRIYTMDGRLVQDLNFVGTTKTVDLQDQPEGMYVIQVIEGGIIIKFDKIIIRK